MSAKDKEINEEISEVLSMPFYYEELIKTIFNKYDIPKGFEKTI